MPLTTKTRCHDRRLKLFSLFEGGGAYTTWELAEMFRVSERTIERDLDILQTDEPLLALVNCCWRIYKKKAPL